MKVFVTIVLDGVGIGEAPDSQAYGDEGSDTLGHVCESERPNLPNLAAAGLGNIRPLAHVSPASNPQAQFGKMQELSAGKDSTSGHWELAGHIVREAFPTYPKGFPSDLIDAFLEVTGYERVLGNRPESGTVIIEQCGAEHIASGQPIVYTSADSVLQIATHVDVVPLERLYEICTLAREQVCIGPHAVGRVIARPFTGPEGLFERLSQSRKDYSLQPPAKNLLTDLQQAGIQTVSVGKVSDLFAGVGFDRAIKTSSNAEGIRKTIDEIQRVSQGDSDVYIWVNLVDFDQEFGHRNNPQGFAGALEEFDIALPEIRAVLPKNGRLVITADHGNDPTTPGSDHSREYVPVLYFDKSDNRTAPHDTGAQRDQKDLGIRSSFCDHAATVAAYFDVHSSGNGKPF